LAGTAYGTLLLAKLLRLASMLACAAANRFVLMPRLRSFPAATGKALLLSVGAELMLGTAVLALGRHIGHDRTAALIWRKPRRKAGPARRVNCSAGNPELAPQ
jgi:hypothetical protein